jgi:hypothetical protein
LKVRTILILTGLALAAVIVGIAIGQAGGGLAVGGVLALLGLGGTAKKKDPEKEGEDAKAKVLTTDPNTVVAGLSDGARAAIDDAKQQGIDNAVPRGTDAGVAAGLELAASIRTIQPGGVDKDTRGGEQGGGADGS